MPIAPIDPPARPPPRGPYNRPVPDALPLILASRSPRRRALLEADGLRFVAVDPPFDDPDAVAHGPDEAPADHAVELARTKAHSLARALRDRSIDPGPGVAPPAILLAADTMCVGPEGRGIGKPADADEARAMLRRFVGRRHEVVTGVCLLRLNANAEATGELAFADAAQVRWGEVGEGALDAYAAGEQWRGKAGGYNLNERLEAGWPIEVEGDPATVMGLPMRRLRGALESIARGDAGAAAWGAGRKAEREPRRGVRA